MTRRNIETLNGNTLTFDPTTVIGRWSIEHADWRADIKLDITTTYDGIKPVTVCGVNWAAIGVATADKAADFGEQITRLSRDAAYFTALIEKIEAEQN